MTDVRKSLGWIVLVCVVMAVVAAWLFIHPADNSALVSAMAGVFILAAVLALSSLAALLIYLMAAGKIDLKYLIAGPDGDASLSRFQMLLFTFVIAALYFLYALYTLLTIKNGQPASVCPPTAPDLLKTLGSLNDAIKASSDAGKLTDATVAVKGATSALMAACSNSYTLPTIPDSVLYLLGISGGSYLLSKGIETAAKPSSSAPDNSAANAPIRKNI